jgi:hypothetical protein
MATYFACADGANRFALVALDSNHQGRSSRWPSPTGKERPIGPSTWRRLRTGGRGKVLGFTLTLTQRLIENGLRRSVRVFTGLDLLENAWMLTLFRDLTLAERISYEGGVDYVEIELGLEKAKLRILRESLRKH